MNSMLCKFQYYFCKSL